MLVQYRLTQDARRRQFLEGATPSERQMLEVDVTRLPREAHAHVTHSGHVTPSGLSHCTCVVLDGEYNALTYEELIPELVTRAREK